MLTDENLRFVTLVEHLRETGEVADYVNLAAALNTNKAGISDIRGGRKKVSIDLLRRMKLSYPNISIEWVVMGTGEMLCDANLSIVENNPEVIAENNLLRSQIKEKDQTIREQAKEIGKLEAKVDQLNSLIEKGATAAGGDSAALAG